MMYFIAAGVLFGSWMAIEFHRAQMANPDQLIGYIQNTLSALGGHIFTLINSSPREPSIQGEPLKPLPIILPTQVTKE